MDLSFSIFDGSIEELFKTLVIWSRTILGLAALACIASPTWRMTGFIIFVVNYLMNFVFEPIFEYQSLVPTTRHAFLFCLADLVTIDALRRWQNYLIKHHEEKPQLQYWGCRGWFRMSLILSVFVMVNFIVTICIITQVSTFLWVYYEPIIATLNIIQSIFLFGGITHGFQYIVGELGKYSKQPAKQHGAVHMVRPDADGDNNSGLNNTSV